MTPVSDWLSTADRFADWSAVSATVAGLGSSGFAAADALLRVGARVEVLDAETPLDGDVRAAKGRDLDALGARMRFGVADDFVIEGDLLVPSPGLRPNHPWISGARTPTIWSGEKLAWQLRPPAVPWLTRHGNKRQDDDGADGRFDAPEWRSRQPCRGQHRATDLRRRSSSSRHPRCTSSSCRVFSCTSRQVCQHTLRLCSTWPTITSIGMVRYDAYVEDKSSDL